MIDLGEFPQIPDVLEKSELNVEFIIVDKYGKKLKYIKGKYDQEIIQEGTQDDKDYDSIDHLIKSNNYPWVKCIPIINMNKSKSNSDIIKNKI